MDLRKKVLAYVKDGMASGELSKAQGHDIVQIMIEYKDLVAKGKIESKSTEEAFKDVIDLHEYKQMTPAQRVHQAIDNIAHKYDVKNPSEELQEVHDMAEGLMEDMQTWVVNPLMHLQRVCLILL